MTAPKVFIILLNWNRLAEITDCLASLDRLDYPNYRVVVVDNGSTDGSTDRLAESRPEVALLCNGRNLGYTGGNNVGMRYALENGADYVWLVNNDTVVEPETLSRLVATGESSDRIGQVSPVIRFYEDPGRLQFHGAYPDWDRQKIVSQVLYGVDISQMPQDEILLTGAALLVKRRVLETVGFFNEKLFAYWEDHDYSVRINRAGFLSVLSPEATVYHKTIVPERLHVTRPPYYYYYTNRNEYFFWTAHLPARNRRFYTARFLASAVADAANCLYAKSPECADACLDGAWNALRGIGGSWDERKHMPRLVKRMLTWHPYLWVALLEGRLRKVFSEAFARLRAKVL